MNPTRVQTQAVERFKCLGADCPDTCCQGWGMQLTSETIAHYEQHAPELLDAVTADESGFVMKRDPETAACVKFEQGLCAIQRDYGDAMLGDACHFFPRITRALGPSLFTTMTLSCPEAARLMLYTPDAFVMGERSEVRSPYSLRNYLPEGMSEADGFAIHGMFMALAADASVTPARSVMRISAVARAIEMQPISAWAEAIPFYASIADSRIPAAEAAPTDLFNLAHAVRGLVMASQAQRPALLECIDAIAQMLGISFKATGGVQLSEDANERALRMLAFMREQEPYVQPVLGRYLQAQISESFFPFAGLGRTLSERITIIGVRFATIRLALATLDAVEEADVVRVIQTLSRFTDHLADPTLSLDIYRETGWTREPRLRAIVGE